MGRLVAEGSFVEEITKDAKGEYDNCEYVASIACVSACELGENFVVIFWWVVRLFGLRLGKWEYLDGRRCCEEVSIWNMERMAVESRRTSRI